MLNQLKELLEKIPFPIVVVLYVLYLGWDFYGFRSDPESQLNQANVRLGSARDEIGKMRKRVQEVTEFAKTLDVKRMELRKLAQELEATKTTLSDSLDTPAFMKSVVTEAQRTGVVVLALKPLEATRKEHYGQQDFQLRFRGVYAQLIAFLDRVSSMQRIVRVDDFLLKPTSPPSSRYVILEGELKLKAFYYLGTRADELAKNGLDSKLNGMTGAPAENPQAVGAGSPAKGTP